MPKIGLRLSNEIIINEDNQLSLKISSDPTNTIQINEDGIYVQARNGNNGTDGGSGYTGPRDTEGIRVGYDTPYDYKLHENHVVMTNIIHRVFTSNNGSGTNLQNFNPDIDFVLPGDIFLYNNIPYLVTKVSPVGYDGKYSSPGNVVVESQPLIQ